MRGKNGPPAGLSAASPVIVGGSRHYQVAAAHCWDGASISTCLGCGQDLHTLPLPASPLTAFSAASERLLWVESACREAALSTAFPTILCALGVPSSHPHTGLAMQGMEK